ncbi:MAG: alanine/ornithine racemase family PLP-dependent enzyme [Ruminiclostridium sp.]|nr:alanine/ornithine racemase family PLP-dependent enzyme [Ruminiclostridium sp.]
MKPYITIDLQKLKSNISYLIKFCDRYNIGVTGVIKGVCGDPLITSIYTGSGVTKIAESRLENLKRLYLKELNIPVMLIRSPALSEVEEVVELADISVNTELEVLKALSAVALKCGKTHNIILMAELGDNREGIPDSEMLWMAKEVKKLKGLKLAGIGTNFTCLSNEPPTIKQLEILAKQAREIVDNTGIGLEIISGGGSSVLPLLSEGAIPKSINDLRIGDSILLGRNVPGGMPIPGLYQDIFKLAGEIIEIKCRSIQSFGVSEYPVNHITAARNKGAPVEQKRAIIGLGSVDVDIQGLTPCVTDVDIVGGTSDHLVLDITHAKYLRLGDWVQFIPDYHALVKCLSSTYISKIFLPKACSILDNGIA